MPNPLTPRRARAVLLLLALPLPTRAQEPDAAPLYREAILQLRAAQQTPRDELVEVPDVEADAELGASIRAKLQEVQPALDTVRKASAIRTCRFRVEGKDPPLTELDDLRFDLLALGDFALLDGRRALEDGDADAAFDRLRTLLGLSRHVLLQTATGGFVFGGVIEGHALDLADRLLKQDPARAAALRDAVTAHRKDRPRLGTLEAAVRTESIRFVDFVLKAAVTADDADSQRIRGIEREVRGATDGALDELLGCFAEAERAGSAEPLAKASEVAKAWRKERPSAAEFAALPVADRARILARKLVMLATPDLQDLGERHLAQDRRMAEFVKGAK